MSLSSAPVVGVPDPSHWPQVFSRGSIEFGSVFVVFTIRDSAGTRAQGKAFLERASELAYDDPAQFSEKLRILCEEDKWTVDSLAAAILRDGKAYVWSWCGGRVVLRRGIKQGVVVDDPQWKVVVGSMQKDDMFVLGTPAFFQAVPVVMDLPGKTAEDVADRAALVLQKSEDARGAAAYIIQCHELDEVSSHNPVTSDISSQDLQQPIGRVVSEVVQDLNTNNATISATQIAASIGSVIRTLALSYGPVFSSVFGRVGGLKLRSHEYGKSKLLLGAIIAAVLFMSGGVLWIRRQSSLEQQRIQKVLAPYQQQFESIQSLASNDKSAAHTQAKELISKLQSQVSSAEPKSADAKKLQALFDDVSQYFTTISGEKKLDQAQVFYNFQLVKSAFIAKRATVDGDTAVFIDPEGLGIMLNLKTKQPSVLDFGGVNRLRDVAIKDQKTYVLGVKDTQDFSIFAGGKSVGPKLLSEDDPVIFRVFGNSGYVYTKSKGELLKMAWQGSSFGDGKNWLRTISGLDKSTVTSIAIDGKVWMGTSNGLIFSLAQGTKQAFTVSGLPQPLTSSIMIYTTPDLANLYVLEPASQRVVVLNKSGVYQSQVSAPELGAATDMFVDATGKTAYVAAGSVVYAVQLE